jgi:hypothetical protein
MLKAENPGGQPNPVERSYVRSLRRPALLLLATLPTLGCGFFYENSYEGSTYTLYSDRNEAFLSRVGEKVTRIYAGYQDLFDIPQDSLGTTTIILEGKDSGVLDYGYSPSVLGYYIPLLNYISIDTTPVCTQREEMLEQVLLHEIGHHFIVTEHPAASQECWLNEGLAGALEVTVFDDRAFEYTLLNPILFQVAQSVAHEPQGQLDLKSLIEKSWGDFHDPEHKERNYALAWSIVYFLLEHHLPDDLHLGKKIEALYEMDRDAISALEPAWILFLRSFDLTGRLVELAVDSSPKKHLESLWAVRQLGTVRALDELRMVTALVDLFDDADPVKRAMAYFSFLQKVEKLTHSYFSSEEHIRQGVDHIGDILDDPSEPAPLREALASALGASFNTRSQWLPSLVHLLDGGEGELRAAAARTLSVIGDKPTIVNPDFWRNAPDAERRREVAEWKAWLSRQPHSPGPLP